MRFLQLLDGVSSVGFIWCRVQLNLDVSFLFFCLGDMSIAENRVCGFIALLYKDATN